MKYRSRNDTAQAVQEGLAATGSWQRRGQVLRFAPAFRPRPSRQAAIASASCVGSNRVVFNIKGNDFRLVAAVAYVMGAMYIKTLLMRFTSTWSSKARLRATWNP